MGLVYGEEVSALICTASEEIGYRLEEMLLHWACAMCVSLRVERKDRLPSDSEPGRRIMILDMDSVALPDGGLLEKEKIGLIVLSRDVRSALLSYRWHPAAFLKPDFDTRRLYEALGACEKYWRKGRVCLESPYKRRKVPLPLGNIRYVEASAHYCVFNHGVKSLRLRFGADEMEAMLPYPPFVRCHRSYIVHLNIVESMSYNALKLKDGAGLPLGRTYVKAVREALEIWQRGGHVQ